MAKPIPANAIFLLILSSLLWAHVSGKECSNKLPQMASHTFRHALLASHNTTWRHQMFSHYHLEPSDDTAWAHLLPGRVLKEDDERRWMMAYRKLKFGGGATGAVKGLLREVELSAVRLDPNSLHGRAQQTNLEYLLMLDVDRLVWSFRKTAGLESPGQPYGGWEAADSELRGHFVGHYLSATVQMWVSTGNATVKQKMTDVVNALWACQQATGSGYLSAFPSEFFDRLEALKPVWAPYYTIHKILAGLLDQYTFAGNDKALNMILWMVDYFNNRVQNVIRKYTIARHWFMLNEETGGMNDVLYRLYSLTGNEKHLKLGYLFDKPCFLGMLAVKVDDITHFHANTHIPVVVGSQARYEVTGDALYKDMATFFMDIVNSSHTYATGGTSVSEFWSDPKRLADTLQTENEESCTSYNMLKVSRNLFRWTKEMAYADHYERSLTNGVLSIQRGRDPGIMIYMLPLARGASKALTYHGWGTSNDSFWCCYGTGIESFAKLGDSIYFDEQAKVPTLYIIQYISSSFNWTSGKIMIGLSQQVEQVVAWDPYLRVTFRVTSGRGKAVLNFRIPAWTGSDVGKALLNGKSVRLPSPGNFLSISKAWIPGDNFTLELPISLKTEAIKDDRPEYASVQAILYGPYLLAGLSNYDWDIAATPDTLLSNWINPIPSNYNSYLITLYQQEGQLSVLYSNGTLSMSAIPQPGTNASVNATFRLILTDQKQANLTSSITHQAEHGAVGKSVMLEPFSFPGSVIVHNGDGQGLGIAMNPSGANGAIFNVVAGLDGKQGSVSLEAADKKGCYVQNAGGGVALGCNATAEMASFSIGKGISEYHPMNFVAKGVHRNFLLTPLLSLRDEAYTVYFNFTG